MKKRTFFSKIQAVRAHESERVSWAFQLSLQTLEYGSLLNANKLTNDDLTLTFLDIFEASRIKTRKIKDYC